MEKDYNSTRNKLIMPEYGRNVQKMVEYAMTIENREERNRCAHTIIYIMGNLFPYLRDTADFKHKLWDHLAIMSDFKLDIDSPYETPQKEALSRHPEKLPYDNHDVRLRHYGHIVEEMIQHAIEVEDPRLKQRWVEDIANYMKKSLLAWNKDFATDDRLFNDIRILSKGQLVVEEGTKTASYHEIMPQRNNYGKNNKRNNKNRNNNNYGKRRRY